MSGGTDKSIQGIILMVAAMGAFAVADTVIKLASTAMSPAHTTLLLIGGGAVIFAILAVLQGQAPVSRAALSPVLGLRYAAEAIGAFSMVNGLAHVPLSTVGAIIQATPLVVVGGAVLFLDEKVSWRRWSAIGLGFVGVLMIVQPGGAGFDTAVFWPVIAMIALAARDLTTRVTPPDMASTTLATCTMLAVLPFAVVWCWLTEPQLLPIAPNWWHVAAMVSFGAVGYLLLTASIRMTAVSTVSPFRYARLLFLLAFGVIFFDERPDPLMLAGTALIIAAGLYTMWRSRRDPA